MIHLLGPAKGCNQHLCVTDISSTIDSVAPDCPSDRAASTESWKAVSFCGSVQIGDSMRHSGCGQYSVLKLDICYQKIRNRICPVDKIFVSFWKDQMQEFTFRYKGYIHTLYIVELLELSLCYMALKLQWSLTPVF